MPGRPDPIALRHRRPGRTTGLLLLVAGLALATLVVLGLREVAPVVSLSVVYLVVVVAVATYAGLAASVLCAIASALLFNFLFLEPTGRFTIADSRNSAALAAYLFVAVVSSTLADTARARAREAGERRSEADLAAEMARTLLSGLPLPESLALTSRRLSQVLEADSAAIELGAGPGEGRRTAIPLSDAGERIGTLVLPADLAPRQELRARERIVPALESILAAALARERLQAEVVETAALRRSDEIKTAVLRAVSHDLRTPITSVLAGVSALQSASVTDQERREVVEDIGAAAASLSRLVDKLLDLARLQSGSAAPNPTWCAIDEVLREAVDQVGAPPDQIRFAIDPGLPRLRADAVQLERAMANLVENAVRHGAPHPVSIRARVVGHRLVVRIVDRGPGIGRYEQDRIFTPFHRGDGAAAGGSGLGLAIAKGFVEAAGGRIAVESLPGQGATFVIDFPIEPVDDADPAAAAGKVAPAR